MNPVYDGCLQMNAKVFNQFNSGLKLINNFYMH